MFHPIDDRRKIGCPSQVAGVDEFVMGSGPASGLRCWRVRSGGRLTADILVDRAFDLGPLEVAGIPLAWATPLGYAASSVRNAQSGEWLDYFGGGFMTTGGLQSIGYATSDDGQNWAHHGAVTHLPPERTCWTADDDAITLTAAIREGGALGVNLLLERRYRFPFGAARIEIEDTITNEGLEEAGIQVLYHFNLGWPLIDGETEWAFPERSVAADMHGHKKPSNAAFGSVAEEGWNIFSHALDRQSKAHICVKNTVMGQVVSFRLTYDPCTLPFLHQWVDRRPGRNVAGLEPATASLNGRTRESYGNGELRLIAPGSTFCTSLALDFHLD